ncbi:MAG: NTP transferase domain-containing protein [Myxococcales bacterium]|nr:NTP transferase domain-containing protein [Myxococcales bacterium]
MILAAGRGSRLGDLTKSTPKALLPLGPRSVADARETTFLERQCRLLSTAGVAKIVVVIGHDAERVAREVRAWELDVHLVRNPTPDMAISGSLHSFQFAARAGLGVLDGSHQTLLLDADIVYDRGALARLLDAPPVSAILVSRLYAEDAEEVRVYGDPDRPRFIGKGMTPVIIGGAPCLGEATGIVKYAPQDHGWARATMDWILGDPDAPAGSLARAGFGPARRGTEHEELAQCLMNLGRMRSVSFGAESIFMEVDTADEYRRMRERVYPRLLQLEASGDGRDTYS